MAKYSSKYDLLKANDGEINQFFRDVKFTGVFDKDIPEEQKNLFCGKLTDIVMNGEKNKLCPLSIYVPKKFEVKIGNCEFICSINLDLLRNEKHNYKLYINSIKNIIIKEVKSFDSNEEALFIRNLKLKDNLFIGQFTQNKDGSFSIRDIRRSDFSKLILQNGKEQQPIVYHPNGKKPLDGKYYEFSWILNGARKEEYVYFFKVDETKPYKEVSGKDIVERLYNSIMDYPAGAGQKIVKMLDTLKNQLTASGKEIFIYELLQNANDYPNIINGRRELVNVEFHITHDSLLFLHSGAEFNERNIAAICSINDKEKTGNKDAIGYKGIGFKTVFLDNNFVYLQTGDFSLRFDQEKTRDIVDTPWQILPIVTPYKDLSPSERYVFTNADKKFRVKLALRPKNIKILRDTGKNYINMFQDVFHNERAILFIPNLSSVKVFYNGTSEPDLQCLCNNNRWQVNNYDEKVPADITESINSDIDDQEDSGALKIPLKYYNFDKTRVSFACEIDGANLKEVDEAQLYCYLPTKASWGFKFLMNTDMIPTGPRDDIEIDFSNQVNINEEIAEIAGSKFFDWIKDLCELKKYKVNSIFNLVPVFETNISQHKKYKNLIDRFKAGFDTRIVNDELIPVENGHFELVQNIILDETGLMSSGIMDDDDFFKITGYEGSLPLKILRNDREFKAFLKRYLKDLERKDNIWYFEDLKEICSDDDFREWVVNQNNNNQFIEFLLKKDKLKDFFEEEIFIEEGTGELRKADDLYFDMDEHLIDLKVFDEHIPHLSKASRDFLKNSELWDEEYENKFSEFLPEDFINDVLLSPSEINATKEKLKVKDTSLHFFKFLAKNEIESNDKIESLPFFNDNDEVVSTFSEAVLFFSSEHGQDIADYDWLSNVCIEFVSSDYDKSVREYFQDNLNVKNFADEIIIKDIILCEDFQDDISEAINENFDTSKSFIDYCFTNKDFLKDGDLRNYTIQTYDFEGDVKWCLSEEQIFFPSNFYDEYSAKEWLNNGWMYVLDKDYYNGHNNIYDFKSFISQTLWVYELTKNNFYKDIVKTNLKDIIANTSDSKDIDGLKNIDFIKYLDDNYHLIFEEEKDGDIFKGLILVDKDTSDVDANTNNLYTFDEELVAIVENDWFPEYIVSICNPEYGNSKALAVIGVKPFKFGDFFDNVIVAELKSINEKIDQKDKNIAFHNFIIEHINALTPDQQKKMLNAKVFLYGHDIAAVSAGGHKTLSAKAKELFDKGLVEFSDLDIIDPDYKTENNVEYWESQLGNTKFTINHFFNWLKNNDEAFSNTLQNKILNIVFWRWLKNNVSDNFIEDVASLPVMLNDGSIQSLDEPVYFSDKYMDGAGIEHIVKIYNNNALFISSTYLDENDDIEEWKSFWVKIGIKYEIVDILVQTVIPRLDKIEDENLPKLFSENREKLEFFYENELVSKLRNLRIKAHDGQFYTIKDTIYIDCEKSEPFSYIQLPNQISFKSAEERRLIKDLIAEVDSDYVSTLSEWQQHKLDCYIAMQTKDCDSVRELHFKFINDLSSIRNNEREVLRDMEGLDALLLLNRHNEFCKASTLTMGSVYNPSFDFELCGVNSLHYVSDAYKVECTEYVGRLFRQLDVHCDFQKNDINLLINRECSIYFWSKYLIKKEVSISRINQFISDKLFDDLACIPTKDDMKTPKDLYYGVEVSRYVKAIEDWENKVPLINLPDIKTSNNLSLFSQLPFKNALNFLDALYALISIQGQDRRTKLNEWMIKDYDESFDPKIHEYREDEHALWFNNKNEKVHIKDLYALDYSDKTLDQYFGTNSRIVNKLYFPSGDSFKKACDILGIKTITAHDLKMEPVDVSLYSEKDKDLKLFALIIAGIIDNKNWQALYADFCGKLSLLKLYKCSKILITYNADNSINQSLKKFYHQNGSNDFYFVKSLDSKRVYTLFVREYMKFLDVNKEDITEELIEDIMDSQENALDIVKEQNTLILDDNFINEIDKLVEGIKGKLSGNKVDDDSEFEEPYRPSFSTRSDQVDDIEESQEDLDEPNIEQGIQNSEDPEDTSTKSSSSPKEFTNKEINRNNTGSGNAYYSANQKVEISDDYNYDTSNEDEYISSIEKNSDYEPLGSTPRSPQTRRPPRPYTKEEVNLMRSNGTPLELESLPATDEEINVLEQCGIAPEQIADTNYLAKLRLYNNLIQELHEEPEEDLEDFIKNAEDVSIHPLKNGRYIHACSAARGVMYTSPSVWKKMMDNKWAICVYLDGQGKNFHYINSTNEFLQLVEKDDVVIKITGKDKVDVVNNLYSGVLNGAKGSAYTLIRVAAHTNMDAVFAHYVGAMAEKEDGNEDLNEF
ncbi:sacsin N-terminal ATP-binding-like domain-containing protein [Plebeiibacterium marinum]|uniref:Uncharacterized protein n=1 Tax=Plebeiibacterium marinum TaxID=2992111 RepID=A0AAE3ME19_9BACT|nr:hypothetical protein [Plebeiobacterium marinum]MCW3805726.1 hypothetical protein [Plebeiobacterium marinum]